MKYKTLKKVALFLILFVVCMFSSHTIGNSFSVQGTPSSIVRLKIAKSIKLAKTNNITDSQQSQKGQMNVLISERRQGFGGSSQDNDSFVEQNKINSIRYDIYLEMYNEIKGKRKY